MTRTKKDTILLADDGVNLRRLQTRVLNRQFPDLKIEEFENGTSLVNRLESDVSNVALVITDNNMPGINGSEIIKTYSQRENIRRIPFILHYGGEQRIGEQAVKDGALDYIMKPADIKKYSALVEKALALSGS